MNETHSNKFFTNYPGDKPWGIGGHTLTQTQNNFEVEVLDSATAAVIEKAIFINLKNNAISVGETNND